MTHRSKLFLGLGLIIIALIAFGCGDDTPAPTNTNQTGELDDPEFVVVQEQIDSYLAESTELFATGLENIYSLPADTEEVRNQYSASGPNDTVSTFYQNGWHVTYVARHNTFFDDYFRDSVMFQIDGQASETATGLDYMHCIRQWQFTDNRTSATHTNKFGNYDLEFEDLDLSVATVNGENNVVYEWNYISNDTNVVALFDMQVTIADVEVEQTSGYGWISGCPTSGRFTFDIDEAYTMYDGLSTDMTLYTWAVVVTVTDGVAAVKVTQNNTDWNYTLDLCNPPTD